MSHRHQSINNKHFKLITTIKQIEKAGNFIYFLSFIEKIMENILNIENKFIILKHIENKSNAIFIYK